MNPLRARPLVIAGTMLVARLASPTAAAEPQRVRVVASEPAKPIYHSPQTPGYTAWTTLWRNPKGELRLAFQQVTGPVEDWAKRKNVTVVLGSADEGATWKSIREVPARTSNPSDGQGIYAAPGSSSLCGHGFAALADGTLVTGLWGVGKETGFVQRSTDEGLTWSDPIYLADPKKFKAYPSQIHQLRDGRLILMAGMYGYDEKPISANVRKYLFQSRDGGKTWSSPIVLMPPEVGLCEESDFVELDNGDLLFSHRVEHYDGEKYLSSNRLQSIVKRKADGGWDIGKATGVPMPHSGFPELLKTRDGSILHIGTDGVWQTGPDLYTWTKLDLPGSPYYPRATQLKDGRILVVGHVGGDDEYGKVDQTIVQQTFRLEVVRDARAKTGSPTLSDLWEGKATWITDAQNIGASFNFHFPSIVAGPDGLWGFYIHNYATPQGKFKMSIGRARGTDGINWTDDGKVLDVGASPSWDEQMASFPGVWKDGDTWYMVYEGAPEDHARFSPGDIGLATSTDGKTWVKHPNNPILRHQTTGWERVNIGTPSLFKENGTWYLFYHGYDGNVCQIGVASGTDLTKLTKSRANPILPVTPGATAWDTGTAGHRSAIVKEGNYYYLAFEASTLPPFARSRWSSGLARTTNLTGAWEKCPRNPLIPQTPGGMGYDGPELLRLGDAWYLYVRTPASNTTQRFKLELRGAGTSSK